jgi:hypothetical protein
MFVFSAGVNLDANNRPLAFWLCKGGSIQRETPAGVR